MHTAYLPSADFPRVSCLVWFYWPWAYFDYFNYLFLSPSPPGKWETSACAWMYWCSGASEIDIEPPLGHWTKGVCVAQMKEIIQLRLSIRSDVQSVLTVGYVALHILVLAVKAKSWTSFQAEKAIKEHDFLGSRKLILKPLKEEDIKMYIIVVLAIWINMFESGVQSNVLLQSWPSPGCHCNCSNTSAVWHRVKKDQAAWVRLYRRPRGFWFLRGTRSI